MLQISVDMLHEQFVHQAQQTPFRTAVVDVSQAPMSYSTLHQMTDQLAAILRDSGVRDGSVVAIYMEKCMQYVVAYLAILKAGGAYLPLDVSYPATLIADVLAEAEPVVILTKSSFVKTIGPHVCQDLTRVISLDDTSFAAEIGRLAAGKSLPIDAGVSNESPAFVVYSSGTTGKPKGIVMPLRSPMLSYQWRHEEYPYNGEEREASNVFFVWELLRPLMKGQTLYIIPDDVIYDPEKLLVFLKTYSITRVLFTPSLLETVLDFPQSDVEEGFHTIRQVWLCGEVTTTCLIEKALKYLPNVNFINLYSISECHDVAAVNLTKFYKDKPEKLKESKFTPVGKLLPQVKVAILDENHKLLPVGMPGEIYVYGPTLAHGYLKRPDLNNKKFIPLIPDIAEDKMSNERMYRTGDWGYLLSDGSLEICGRCDAMVKIRGYSVEMSAIENTLIGLRYIQTAVVVVNGEEGDDKALVAYVVLNDPTPIKQIRGDLKRRLPFYMIPSFFVILKEIPILPGSGKLNKSALPPLNKAFECQPDYLPETETEKALSVIWCDVLQMTIIDVHESFFDLGGHSLLATKLLQIVNSKFCVKFSVKDFYNNPTINGMGRLIDNKSPERVPDIDLEKEVENHCQYDTDLDIQLRAFWRFSNFNKTRWSNACVLLTGSTGYLGAFLAAELLKSTESHIFCLIRESVTSDKTDNVVGIQKRFIDTMLGYHLMKSDATDLTESVTHRVTFVKGDVSLINFGLSEDDYRYLATEIDYVIHAAAYVNLVYPYSALYSSNVLGTCNVIKFASHSKIKPLHYISTDAVFPNDLVGKEDADLSKLSKRLRSGYSQSKWVAEQIVMRSSQMGHPTIIYRLGNQAADSVNGSFNEDDFNFLMIRSFTLLGCCPKVDWSVEMTPVDFTAKVIVEFARDLSNHIGKVYHLINQKPITLRTLQSWLSVHGYKCDVVSYPEFLERLKTSNISSMKMLYSLLREVASSPNYFKHLPIHDAKMTRKILTSKNLDYPEMNNALLTLYFTKFIERNIIPKPKHQGPSFRLLEESNLTGKVAVVTGASSGIGEETAMQLARNGCLVAMIARREDRLCKIQDMINSLGGKAIYVKADVTVEAEVDKAMDTIETVMGPIDILVNCAGVMFYQRAYRPKMADCNVMIDVNIKGLLYCTSRVLPGMVQRKKGHIVNISSDAGKKGFPGLSVYSGTKFFVEGYSQAIRSEVSKFNIRVSNIQPGDVQTPLQDASIVDEEAAKEYYTAGTNAALLETKDIARTIIFVLSCPDYMAVNEILVEPTSAPI